MNFSINKPRHSAINFLRLLIMLSIMIAVLGCDSSVFENKIDTILVPVDQVNFLSISSPSISDSTWTKPPKRDKPVRLLIGGFEGYESAALLRFGKLSALPEESLIESIQVQLTVSNTIGKQPSSSIVLSLYQNRIEWNEDGLVTRRLEDFTPLAEDLIDTATVSWHKSDSTSDKFSFNIPFSLVQIWKDSSDTNGVIIVGDNSSNFIISSPTRTSGLSGSSLPLLQVTYQDTDTTKTENILATSNGFILSITTGLPLSDPERIYIGGGAAYRGFYRFDSALLDGIPETSKISNAEFKIAIDSSRSILPNANSSVTGIGFTLYFSYLDSSSESGDLFPTPISDSTSAQIPIDGNIISLNMTSIFQRWIAQNFENKGLVIWSGSEGNQLFRVALDRCDTVTAPPSCVQPELKVYYVTSEGIED